MVGSCSGSGDFDPFFSSLDQFVPKNVGFAKSRLALLPGLSLPDVEVLSLGLAGRFVILRAETNQGVRSE